MTNEDNKKRQALPIIPLTAETFTKDIQIRMTADQARVWLDSIQWIKHLLANNVTADFNHYDRINRLEIQLQTALDNSEAFGVTQTASVAIIEVSL